MRKAALNSVLVLAKKNKKVLFIGSDLGPGVLSEFKQKFPDRFFMEGIAEQNIIGISAGLAFDGFIPYVNTISTFLTRRCYEQIVVDLCLHNLPVRLIGNGGGLVYAPLGPTHQAIEDISILRVLPNMTILCPCDSIEMEKLMRQTINWKGPIYIRLAKGGDKIITNEKDKIVIGDGVIKKSFNDAVFISTGIMTQECLYASNKLDTLGYNTGVLHLHTLSNFNIKKLKILLQKVKYIVTVEEHFEDGGLGSIMLEFLNKYFESKKIILKRLGLPKSFVQKYGNQELLLKNYKLKSNYIANSMIKIMKKN